MTTRAIDLSRDAAPPLLGWILLVVGLGAAMTGLLHRQQLTAARAEAERHVQARLESQRPKPGTAAVASPSPAAVRRLAAQVESRTPWLATLSAIESTTREPVYLRAVTIEPGSGDVKLEAEASSFAEALAYVQELDAAELLHPALLRSHEESVDPVRGTAVVRFSVVARWNRR